MTLALLGVLAIGAFAYVAPSPWNALVDRPGLSILRQDQPKPFRLGLDLKGGTHLVYEADTSAVPSRDRRASMEGVRDVIERRVNALGVAEPIVQLTENDGRWRLIVELAGVYDTDRAIATIGATPVLEFRELAGEVKLSADQQKVLDTLNAGIKKRMQEEVLPQALAKDGDFATLARVHSEDPGSRVKDGDLGWFRRGVMVKEFEEVVFGQLKEGQVTKKLVETEFGWHLIKKTGEREVEETTGVLDAGSITAVTESGSPANVEVKVEPKSGAEGPAKTGKKVKEVRASHILFRKKTAQDLLGLDGVWAPTGLGGKQLDRAYLAFDPNSNQPIVSLEFDKEGERILEEVSGRNVDKPLAIFIDGLSPVDVTGDGVIDASDVYAPNVTERITGGSAVITGLADAVRAKELANRLQAGALPVPIGIVAQTTVGATRGDAVVAASTRAAFIGFAIVAAFMIVYYRLPGVASVLALTLYGIFVLAVLKLANATLTLAGIAGFVMSLGMAVDANVLIAERLKEELRRGRSTIDAVDVAFHRAWTAIRDSNVTTLITCAILATFSSSVVKGFAVTLAVGVLVSMATAMVATRALLRPLAARFSAPAWYGVRRASP